MRLWSLHPRYLDWKGLNALWREALLAQAVLLGRTEGWRDHPQLLRFKSHEDPVRAIGFHRLKVYEEACDRGYSYDRSRVAERAREVRSIVTTKAQLLYEFTIVKDRLKRRSPPKYRELLGFWNGYHPRPHPLFVVVEGDVEPWEKSYWRSRKRQSAGKK